MNSESFLTELLSSADPVVILASAKFIILTLTKECLTTHNENNYGYIVQYTCYL